MRNPDWQTADGTIRLYHVDCCAFFPEMKSGSVEHCITDPPYDQRTHERARSLKDGGSDIEIDFAHLNDMQHVEQMLRVSRRWVLAFCALEQLGEYKAAAGHAAWTRAGIWDRPDGTPALNCDRPGQAAEGIAIMHSTFAIRRWNAGGKRGMWRCGVDRSDIDHPTAKPIRLMEILICDFTNVGDLVFDPFMGSGTTGAACIRHGRNFIGIESDEKYFDVCVRRLEAELNRHPLLEPPRQIQRALISNEA